MVPMLAGRRCRSPRKVLLPKCKRMLGWGNWLLTANIIIKLRVPRFLVESLIDGPCCPCDWLELLCRRVSGYLSSLLFLLGDRLALTLGSILRCAGVGLQIWLIELASLTCEAMGRRLNVCAW